MIQSLDLDQRTQNCFRGAGIDTLEKLLAQTEAEILKIPNFGRKSLAGLKAELLRHGLTLYIRTDHDDMVSHAKWQVRRCEVMLKNAQDALDVAKTELATSQERLDLLLAKQ